MNTDQKQRHDILRKAGIDAKNQQIAVHTIQQLQNMLIQKADEACLHYLRAWLPELREKLPSTYQDWLIAHGIKFQAVEHTREKLTGVDRMIYCLYREAAQGVPEMKRAFETCAKIVPVLEGNGLFRLDYEHSEIPFPANIKIVKS